MTRVKLQRGVLLGAWVLGTLFVALNVALSILYQDRIYPGVRMSGTNLSNLTRQQATALLQRQTAAFHIALSVDGKRYNVKPVTAGATYNVALSVESAYNQGRNGLLPLVGMLSSVRPRPVSLALSVDRTALKDFVSTISTTQAQAPVDATVVVKGTVPTVLPDKKGLGVNKALLETAILAGLDGQLERVSVTRSEISADVQLAQATSAAITAVELMARHITLTYQDKSFTPSAAQIGAWLEFIKQDDGTLRVDVNQTKVQAYFSSFAPQVEIAAVTKKVTAVNGVVKEVQDGSNGLAIDRPALAAKVAEAVTGGSLASIVVPTAAVAFKTVYNNTISLDVPQYIEVNLSTQHLWAYQDHQVAYESPITSGATGAGFPTVTGLFSIYGKETNRYLNGRGLGYNYNVFVQYWMPFYADYGLHDASWRNGQFGGQDYYYNGSHGCVNLPTATAAWLFNWASIGTPVWVHT